MNANGEPTAQDLPPREKVKAALPATGALLGMLALILFAAFAYSSNRADEAQRAATKQNERLFHLSTARFQYATNRSVCGFRHIAQEGIANNRQVIARSNAALKDPTTSAGSKRRNLKAKQDAQAQIRQAREFLDTQVTVPFDYNCAALPDAPPRETLPGT